MSASRKIALCLLVFVIVALIAGHYANLPDPHAPIYYECSRGVCQRAQNGERLKDERDPYPADADTITTYREVWDGHQYVQQKN
jgi:hypothetical protein